MESIIYDLSNEEYHHGEKYQGYLSSSQLQYYRNGLAEAKRLLDDKTPKEPTPAMQLGSLMHDALESIHKTGDFSLTEWQKTLAVFNPPVNPSTGIAFGASTKKYQEAYQEFLQATEGKQIVSEENLNIVKAIARSAERHPLISRVLMTGTTEASHFIEFEGCGFKWRPDLENSKQIWDWKSINGTLDDDTIRKRILDCYDVQASFYQFFEHEQSDIWKSHYICWFQTCEPYGIRIDSMQNFAYSVEDGIMVNDMNHGPLQFKALLNAHIHCTKADEWSDDDLTTPADENGRRIHTMECPAWALNKITEYYF